MLDRKQQAVHWQLKLSHTREQGQTAVDLSWVRFDLFEPWYTIVKPSHALLHWSCHPNLISG